MLRFLSAQCVDRNDLEINNGCEERAEADRGKDLSALALYGVRIFEEKCRWRG